MLFKMIWILLTIFAAFMQSWRNALQSKLSAHVSVAGVTLARFIVASPIAGLYLYALYYYQDAPLPSFNPLFISYIIGASIVQIIATGLMVKLFKMNNFAVGAGLAKSEERANNDPGHQRNKDHQQRHGRNREKVGGN